MSEQKQNEIEYIEPTQEHVGQMVEVSDDFQHWYFHKLLGIINAKQKYIVEEDLIVFGWVHARIPRPNPQQKPVPVSSVPKETQPNDTHDTPKPIDWTKPVRTKGTKKPVRIVCTDGPGDYPVVGFIGDDTDPYQWTLDGNWLVDDVHDDDLENAPQRIQREYWVNVYDDSGYDAIHDSAKHAAEFRNTKRNCLACVKITIDCEEGEGL